MPTLSFLILWYLFRYLFRFFLYLVRVKWFCCKLTFCSFRWCSFNSATNRPITRCSVVSGCVARVCRLFKCEMSVLFAVCMFGANSSQKMWQKNCTEYNDVFTISATGVHTTFEWPVYWPKNKNGRSHYFWK